MSEFDTSVMIALLPTTTDWCHIDLPHMTLVYAGEVKDLNHADHNEMAKLSLDLALACEPFSLVVMGVDVFGDEEDPVEVLVLRKDPEVLAMHSVVKHWDKSKHPFNPHVTVGQVGTTGLNVPDSIAFDRIAVCWGKSKLTYRLTNHSPMKEY
jgi:2'-5' RNA ligase